MNYKILTMELLNLNYRLSLSVIDGLLERGTIMKYKIFIIWQSQNKCINKFIQAQLTKAQKKVEGKKY